MKSDDCFCRKAMTNLDKCTDKQRHCSADKGLYSQSYGLPSGHVWLWELGCKEGRTPQNWCLWTVVLEKTPESPLDSKEIKPVNLKGDEYSLEGLLLKLKLQYIDHLMRKYNSLEKSLMLGKIKGRRRRGCERMRWLDYITDGNELELGQTLGDGEGQGALACCSSWGHKESDTTGWLNNDKWEVELVSWAWSTA